MTLTFLAELRAVDQRAIALMLFMGVIGYLGSRGGPRVQMTSHSLMILAVIAFVVAALLENPPQ